MLFIQQGRFGCANEASPLHEKSRYARSKCRRWKRKIRGTAWDRRLRRLGDRVDPRPQNVSRLSLSTPPGRPPRNAANRLNSRSRDTPAARLHHRVCAHAEPANAALV